MTYGRKKLKAQRKIKPVFCVFARERSGWFLREAEKVHTLVKRFRSAMKRGDAFTIPLGPTGDCAQMIYENQHIDDLETTLKEQSVKWFKAANSRRWHRVVSGAVKPHSQKS